MRMRTTNRAGRGRGARALAAAVVTTMAVVLAAAAPSSGASAAPAAKPISTTSAPLRRGELQHVRWRSYQYDFPARAGEPRLGLGGAAGYSGRSETWVGLDAANRTIAISPDVPKQQCSGSRPLHCSLTQGVLVIDDPAARAHARQVAWRLIRGRFVKTYDQPLRMRAQSSSAGLRSLWGATGAEIARLPASGPALDRAVRDIVADPSRSPFFTGHHVPTPAWGMTATTLQHELEVQAAIHVLGAAPLPKPARLAVFRGLLAQRGAHVTTRATDRAGRHGTLVSFDTVFDRQVPARTVTRTQLLEESRAAGATDLPAVAEERTYEIAAHREFRRWHAAVWFDPTDAELLQSETATWLDRPVPMPMLIQGMPGSPVHFTEGGAGGEGGGFGALYLERGHTTTMVASDPLCRAHPKICTV